MEVHARMHEEVKVSCISPSDVSPRVSFGPLGADFDRRGYAGRQAVFLLLQMQILAGCSHNASHAAIVNNSQQRNAGYEIDCNTFIGC